MGVAVDISPGMDAEKIEYTDSSYPCSLLSSMDTLRKAGDLCDCILRVGKKMAEYTAHQCVLASISPHFMAMFKNDPNMMESKKTYKVPGITPQAFEVLLDFAYTGRLTVNSNDLTQVYESAVKLKFNQVANICSQYMMKSLNLSNCLEIRECASKDESLQLRVNEFIQENIEPLKETKSFLAIPQINVKILGSSRAGSNSTADSTTVSRLISDWLTTSDADSLRSCEGLLEHETVLYLDDNNLLVDASTVDQVLMTDEVQDYTKRCKKYGRSMSLHCESYKEASSQPVQVVAHEKIKGSTETFTVLLAVYGTLYSVFVDMSKVAGGSGPVSRSTSTYCSSASSGEEEEHPTSNGIDLPGSTVSSFEPLADMTVPRCGVGLTALDGQLIAIGGNDRGECFSSCESYDPHTNVWRPLGDMSCARGRFECAVVAGKLYACGGSDGRKELDTAEFYCQGSWQPLPNMPTCKSSAGVGVLNNKLCVIGGYSGQRALTTCEMYDPVTSTWSHLPPLNVGRSQAAVCAYKGRLYVFGGTDSWNCYTSAEVYNPVTNSWAYIRPMSQARRGAAAAVFNGRVYLVGGSDGQRSLSSVEIYHPEVDSWSNGPPLRSPRSNAGLAVCAGRLYVTGGYGKNQFLSDMELLESDTDSQWCVFVKEPMHTSSESEIEH